MPKTYTTILGDVWDMIAYKELGSTAYTAKLMEANQEHIETAMFSAGTVLTIPDIDTGNTAKHIPPWRRK
ncbi:tail protein X [Selenomonas sp. AE3005]|uniref:tail protein X n=1 Tax=Selenomonas sp. AE3005 TaxID=1485543 RepID=UPI0025EB1EC9|nr:tail protein X [Selenomonas sp. AE3005]